MQRSAADGDAQWSIRTATSGFSHWARLSNSFDYFDIAFDVFNIARDLLVVYVCDDWLLELRLSF